ncbi:MULTISPECIES: hypothetical protein [unclassified Streptomyces]|uniref:hypothetical protein n=1 Tax=unclassified Streptomyces TaxID=2593676 RepID=UPI0036EE4A23
MTATDNTAVRRSWSPAFDLMGGQKLDQGRNAGCKLGDADGPTRRPLDVNRPGGECRRVPGDGIRGTAPADQP